MKLRLPSTARAMASGDNETIQAALEQDLIDESFAALDEACSQYGGAPDDECFEVNDIQIGESGLTAQIGVSFTEVRGGGGCADMPLRVTRWASLVVTLPPGEQSGDVQTVGSRESWDILDWNSAGDGT